MYSKKIENISPSMTLELSAKVKELQSQGIEVINLTVGEPDFKTPSYIIDGAIRGISNGFTKYTATSGIIELKKEIVKKFKEFNSIDYNSSNILVSTGAKQCLFNAILAIIEENDEVIIPAPYWVSYTEMVKISGGKSVIINTSPKNDFKVTVDELDKHLTDKAKLLILNNPNNPTGSVYSEEELLLIGNWAIANNIFIISDEIYERLTYGCNHTSLACLGDEIKEKTITISGFSKTYSMTGWRLGYCAANEKLIKLMTSIQSHSTACANSIAQYAGYIALLEEKNNPDIEYMISEFSMRRKIAIDFLLKNSRLDFIYPSGAFYIFIDISFLKNKIYKDQKLLKSSEIAKVLLNDYKVAVVPGEAFGNDDYIRISYATDEKSVSEGLNRLIQFEKSIR
ncbi:pyridoxal phosphate-dependent aminotransferase [Lagierella sp.]|uniref:pyridoxal phosphate-dependent aminotransferase n=1 Tax=Lagierella sp. TaxID=2849657 RepID=UPI002631DB02|nr:pyridoxal phosphate-dependent aminotransferase [Lagierella sp.]